MQQTLRKRGADNPPIVEAATSPTDSESRMSEMAAILAAGIVRLKSRLGSPAMPVVSHESLSVVANMDGR